MGTKKSGILWEIVLVSLLLLMVPISIGISQGILFTPDREVTFSPENNEEFDFTYVYDDGSEQTDSTNLYTKNETGDDYHVYITPEADNATFVRTEMEFNYTVDEAIEDGANQLRFKAAFPYGGEVQMKLIADDGNNTDEILAETTNVSTGMTNYYFDFETIDLLVAEDNTDPDAKLVFQVLNEGTSSEAEEGNVLPPDSTTLDFDGQLLSDYATSPMFSLNLVSAILSIVIGISAIFATPWVDLSDITRMWK
ncbi:MAG: hypothetical protein ACOC53_05410 [Candidatus Saliniplasma sp.]